LQASSEARNERQLYDYQKVAVGTVIACLRAAVHVMQETDYSVPLERLAGMKTFWREQVCPLLRTGMTQTAGGCCVIGDRARKRDYEYGVS
ncbi:MAG: hypothetical protein MRZ28_08895, partial [Oscillospiraceae bacterium]|nr:hypothetical protein [Oscillospiraceae bacterium]MDY3219078.1 hypothetical protein [Candidatus Fimivivens sp.]